VGFLHFWHAHSSREHAVLKSRRVDGQARQGSGCVRGSERISRTSPEPSSESFRAWAFFCTASTGPSRRSLGGGWSTLNFSRHGRSISKPSHKSAQEPGCKVTGL